MSAIITLDAPGVSVPGIRRVRTAAPARQRLRPMTALRSALRRRHGSAHHESLAELRAVSDVDALGGFSRAHRVVA